ncbi:MAG: EAL domain-containing protein [Xanthobacteraceae bacterium]|jgi:diguanylate cyclase (GGDEF)-like protein/PAS domain S-box-containing protein
MAKWALALRQTTTYLGLVAIAIIWVGIYLLSSEQRQLAYQDALRQGSNLARVLEEYIRRVVQESDNALLALRQDYQRDPQNFDLPAWVAHTQSRNNLTAHFGITDAKGFVILSSHGPLRTPLDVADRRPFTFQRDSTGDHLFISAPLIGQVSRRLTIEFTRRLNKADGTFSGTVASALDVSELERFFSSLDLGRGGIVSLVSNDAVVLARGGTDPKTRGFAGMTVRQTRLFQMLKNGASGTYWNAPSDSAHFEGVERLMSYRAVSGIPLIAVVGLAQGDIFRHANATLRKYLVAGTILTLIVLIVMFVGAARQARMLSTAEKLRQSTRSLERSNLLFKTALESMAHGLCIFDRDMRLVVCNEQYAEMYGLRPEQILPGTTLRSVLEARVSAGLVPGDANQYIRSRLAKVSLCDAHYAENDLSDGRVYAVSHRPMPDGGWVATHIDVTEQRRAERQLGETKQFLDSIIEHIPVAIVVKDATTRKYILVNRAFETMLGIPRSELLGRTTFDIHRPKDAKNVDDADTEAIQNSDHVSYNELEVDTLLRGARLQATHRIVIKNNQGDAKVLITVIEDATERKKAEQRIAFLAHHDPLTGLANRAALAQKIEEAAARQRRRNEPFSVLLLDLDRFKEVNDTLGHPAGDTLLTEVAMRLKSLLRETDVLARLGGDEFAIIQAGESDPRGAAQMLAERILEFLGKPFAIDGGEINIGTSIGIALAPEHGTGSGELLKMADLALYRTKSAGRNGYSFFDPEMSELASARQEIENDLRRAIQQNELELHYQPILNAKTRKISSVEALVRWRHPTKGLLFPDLFVPLAEETGLIAQIGDWVLRKACADAVAWPDDVKVAVNLSLVQFRKTKLADTVMRALVDSGLRPERLELEITETALIESAAECLPALRQFKSLGITIVLDDFGTGYSSLSQLAMFPFDRIKIDKSFTQNLTKRSECAAIISATLTLAQSLDIATTAEGVETVDQYRVLRLAGVTSVQGYLFKRPGPVSELDFNAIYGAVTLDSAA